MPSCVEAKLYNVIQLYKLILRSLDYMCLRKKGGINLGEEGQEIGIDERGVRALERIATVLENFEDIYKESVKQVEDMRRQAEEELERLKEEEEDNADPDKESIFD